MLRNMPSSFTQKLDEGGIGPPILRLNCVRRLTTIPAESRKNCQGSSRGDWCFRRFVKSPFY
jgi:hypothetical protein